MQSLDDAVASLEARGLRAQRHLWALGDTIVVTHAHGEMVGEIELFPLALYIVCSRGTWEVVDCMRSGSEERTPCGSLDEACDIVTARIEAWPNR